MKHFLNDIDIESLFNDLFSERDGVHFFLKDINSRHVFVSSSMLSSLQLHPANVEGKLDTEIYSASLGEKYRRDDLKVFESGQPLIGIIELFLNEQGVPAWHSTDKYPVFDRSGKIMGVAGTVKKIDENFTLYSGKPALITALKYIEKHYADKIDIKELAYQCDISVRSFQRSFQRHFLTTPKQFIIKRRCYEACFLLKQSSLKLAEVASRAGFYDQSDFSRQFSRVMRISPNQYRQRYL